MIYFKTTKFKSNQNPDDLLNRLTWKLYRSDNLLFAKTNIFTADTLRPLIGKIDDTNKSFKVTRLRPFLQSFILPQILVTGQLTADVDNSVLTIKYRLGILSTIFFLVFFYLSTSVIFEMLTSPNSKDFIFDIAGWFLLFIVTPIILIFFEINKTTNKLIDVLGLSV